MNFEIEKEFLGIGFLNPKVMDRIVISSSCFFDDKNKFIFNLMMQQYKDSKTLDIQGMVTNYSHLFKGKYKASDMILLMTECIDLAVTEAQFDYLQETLFSRYIRQMILEQINQFHSNKISTDEMLDSIHKYESMSIKLDDNKLTADEIFKVIHSVNKNIELRFKNLSDVANIQEHDFIVIAARPGIGKTGFLLNILEDISDKYNCILFNMEMSEKQVYQRLVSINTGIPIAYQSNPETDYQKTKLKDGCKNLAKKKIKIYSQGQTINSIRRKIINESKNEHTIAFIDYVGLIGSSDRGKTLYEKITSIVKELRQISLDYDCTIFLVSQINRNSEKDKDKTPKISDLKESGELEQSATTVIMLHDENHGKNISKKEIEMSFIIGKNRNGKTGITKLNYNKETQKYDIVKKGEKDPNYWRKE